jgi:GDPmannose 4,6-dehydratase
VKNSRKKALIFGVTGQDGSYLAEFLLQMGYEVHGLIRRSSSFNTGRLAHLYQDPHYDNRQFFLHYGDVTDPIRVGSIVSEIKPDEIYNLAAQSHVRVSFDEPLYTGETVGLAAASILEAVRKFSPESSYYQASSSEMFGATPPPQSEDTPFYPRSPYGVAKVYAYWLTRNYREAYAINAYNGILFNHESPRRGETFVTRKITQAVARIHLGLQEHLYLGNLESVRDWGYAPEYVVGMWKLLQQKNVYDVVLATGTAMSVGEFVDASFSSLGMDSREFVRFDERYLRPTEVDALIGDASLAKNALQWEPNIHGASLVEIMVREDLNLIKNEGRPYIDKPRFGIE